MNRIKFVLGLLAVGAACSASAQLLEFTNLTLSTSPNLFHGMTNRLNGVAYGGNSNFVAVGANQIYVCGDFQPGQTLLANSNWITNQILPANGLNLAAVTLGANLFVATGQSNNVFSAANSVTASGLAWTKKFKIFNNSVVAPAITYNANGYVAVGESPQLAWSGPNLPTTANWALGTLANPDFAESFRGATAYGPNGFAVCGLFADVRLSSDGTNWQAAVSGKIGLPDFFGIAYDGSKTLVCVGATNSSSSDNGVVMASTNNGTNWQTVYVNNTSATPLNAVTYTGSGFIAVGNKGLVLTSPNGTAWTVITNAVTPTNANLYGIAYATNGAMIGVGEVVGDSGAVILMGTPPPAPVNPIGATNCATYPNSPSFSPLSITPVTNATHPAGTVTVDWYDVQGNLVASGTTNLSPTINPNIVGLNVATNIIFYAKERDLRTGFSTTNGVPVTLQLIPRPTATLPSSTIEICNTGASFTLTNTLTGIGPWTVYWNDGTIQTQTGSGPVTLTRVVNPTNSFANVASNNVYYVTVVTNADMCMGNAPGDITGTNTIIVDPRPTANLLALDVTNCDEGAPFVLTNVLTGLGPWSVTWNDGTVQTLPQTGSGPVILARTVAPTNSPGANAAIAKTYYITSVSDENSCTGNQPGDISGTNLIVINPRPAASLVSFNATNCNDGTSFTLTNILTGIGPWTVTWNDGTIQPVPLAVAGPVTLARTVYPTNSVGANAASNNVYFVTAVANADTCVGNLPGDISGTNSIVINPRPTAALTPLSATNCNSGTTYTLTNTLTGIGPWTIYWNDGTTQSTSGSGPVTLTRAITPSTSSANASSNNVYYVVVVTNNSDTCVGNLPGDITGTNQFLINPLPTVTLKMSTNDFGVFTNGLPSGLLESVSRPQKLNLNVVVGFQALQNGTPYSISNQVLIITNHLVFTGIGPWNVTLSDGNTNITTNYTANADYVWQEIISTNFDTNFTFSVQSVTDTNSGCSGSSTNIFNVIVYVAPTAIVTAGTNTVCGSGAAGAFTISAALGGFGPWTNVVWSDGYINTNVLNGVASRPPVSFTNNTFAPVTTNLSVVSLTDRYGVTTTSSNDLAGNATIDVDPYVAFAPLPIAVTNFSCPGVGIPLSVSVPPGFTADWFADSTLLTNLAVGATNYIAVVNAQSTNVYYVTMRYNDAFSLTNCAPDLATNIYLIAASCSNSINSITLTGTNAVISWSGNYILQSATNLAPPIMWMNVYTGALGPNFLTNPATEPNEFFRLTSPTN